MPKFIVRYQRAFMNYPETMILDVSFQTAAIKNAILKLIQKFHPTATNIEEILMYQEKKPKPRRAVYTRPSKLL